MEANKSNKTIFLDRDGTLIKEKHYLIDPKEVEIETTVLDALHLLQEHGYTFIIITNQAGIGKGHFTESEYQATQNYIEDLFKKENIIFQKII